LAIPNFLSYTLSNAGAHLGLLASAVLFHPSQLAMASQDGAYLKDIELPPSIEAATSTPTFPPYHANKRPATVDDMTDLLIGNLPPMPTLPMPEAPSTTKRARTTKQKAPSASAEEDSPAPTSKAKKGRAVDPSKRAEQNRAAQKAFRERKDVKMRELEEKVAHLEKLNNEQAEMDRLRLSLQERERALTEQENSSGGMARHQQEAYERRLNELGDEVKRLQQVQATSAPNELNIVIQDMQKELDRKTRENQTLNALLIETRRALADREERLDAIHMDHIV